MNRQEQIEGIQKELACLSSHTKWDDPQGAYMVKDIGDNIYTDNPRDVLARAIQALSLPRDDALTAQLCEAHKDVEVQPGPFCPVCSVAGATSAGVAEGLKARRDDAQDVEGVAPMPFTPEQERDHWIKTAHDMLHVLIDAFPNIKYEGGEVEYARDCVRAAKTVRKERDEAEQAVVDAHGASVDFWGRAAARQSRRVLEINTKAIILRNELLDAKDELRKMRDGALARERAAVEAGARVAAEYLSQPLEVADLENGASPSEAGKYRRQMVKDAVAAALAARGEG